MMCVFYWLWLCLEPLHIYYKNNINLWHGALHRLITAINRYHASGFCCTMVVAVAVPLPLKLTRCSHARIHRVSLPISKHTLCYRLLPTYPKMNTIVVLKKWWHLLLLSPQNFGIACWARASVSVHDVILCTWFFMHHVAKRKATKIMLNWLFCGLFHTWMMCL